MEAEVNRNIEEQLSAFLDGELSADELQLLVRRLERNEKYRATLARYAGIGGILRNDRSRHLAAQLRINVMSALQDDRGATATATTTALPSSGVMRQSWFKPTIAAALAALVIAGLLNMNLFPPADTARVQNVATTVSTPATSADSDKPEMSYEARSAVVAESPRRPVSQERMLSYLVSHGEHARAFQGAMMDSRVFVQQASFEE